MNKNFTSFYLINFIDLQINASKKIGEFQKKSIESNFGI